MSEQGFPVTSRFRILATPVISPGKCAVCGAVDRPVIDFDTTVPLYGAVMLCFSCTQEAARGVGMVDKSELDTAKENLARTLEEQLHNAGMIGVPRERYDDIVMAFSGFYAAFLPSGVSSATPLAGPHGEVQSTLFGDNPEAATGDSGNPEQNDNPVVSERPASVSSGSKHGSTIRNI
jgi:hypothetical protein